VKKKLLSVVLATGLLLGATNSVYGVEEKVVVTIPTFSVELQHETYNNLQAEYPLLVYKDITYFPLTYNLTRQMNLITGWDNEKGFFVSQCLSEWTGERDGMDSYNLLGRKYQAVLPTYPITINGVTIDNTKEEYPLLNFRDVTYFPMTWKYIHDEFGWMIEWSDDAGLKVNLDDVSFIGENLYLSDIGKRYVLLQRGGEKVVPNYSLDCEKNEIAVLMASDGNDFWQDPAKGTSIYEEVKIENNQVLYQDMVLKDVSAWEDVQISTATLFAFEDCSFIGLRLDYNTDTPALYPPRVYSVIQVIGKEVKDIEIWNDHDALVNVYETKDAYYLGTDYRWIANRWSKNLATTVRLDKASKETVVLNTLWDDYKSVELLGVGENVVYLRNTYFGDWNGMTTGKGQVSAVNDGYFALDEDMNLHKLYGYIEGETFVGTNGELFVIDRNVLRITNISDGIRIEW